VIELAFVGDQLQSRPLPQIALLAALQSLD
jgi:hypothetical protein